MTRSIRTLLFLALPAVPCSTPALAQVWEECNLLHSWTGEGIGDAFGWVGREAGDVDGDGVMDVIVGANGYSGGGLGGAGKAYVYSGATGALLFDFAGSLQGAGVGVDVAPAGDFDGDGKDEVLVGASGFAGRGAVFVLSGANGSVLLQLDGVTPGEGFGAAVEGAGDIDGDGVPEVLVGSPFNSTIAPGAGRASLWSGATGTLITESFGTAAGDNYGSSVGTLRDRNGDGTPDWIVGASGSGATGQAFVFDGATGSLDCTLDGDATSGNYGTFFIGYCGDIDGDGGPDFFVGDFSNSALGAGTGRVFVYSGSDCGLIMTITGDAAGEGYGIGRGYCGDYDGDGRDDLFFGSWVGDDGGNNAGMGKIHSGVDGRLLGKFTGDVPGANLGFDAAGLGDVDGDGVPDFVLTAATQMTSTGTTHVLSGAPTLPRSYCVSQPNSVGPGAVLSYRKSTSLTTNDLRLRVEGGVPGESLVFAWSFGQNQVPFGDGVLCLAAPIFRLGAPETFTQGGNRQITLDFSQGPLAGGPGAITGGATVHWQAWYRDPMGGSGFNLTQGLSIVICP